MTPNLEFFNNVLWENLINITNSFFAIYNSEGNLIKSGGIIPSYLPHKIINILESTNLVQVENADYDYFLENYEEHKYYIYKFDNNNEKMYIVIGLPHLQKNKELEQLLPVGILKINKKWEAFYANEHLELLFGLSQNEIFGNRWVSILEQKFISEIFNYFHTSELILKPYSKIFKHLTPLGRKRVLSFVLDKKFDFNLNEDIYIGIVQDITKEYEANQKSIYNATHDNLTNLFNRSALLQEIRNILEIVPLENLALLFLDLDGFKYINDTLGHHMGDEVLKVVARKLQHTTKQRDIVARIGGDEFVVFLNNIKTNADLYKIANKISSAVNSEVKIENQNVQIACSIGVSMGVSLFQMDIENLSNNEMIDKWFSTADIAMYESKKNKRGEVVIFDKSFHENYLEEKQREKFLLDVLSKDLVKIYFQPIYYKEKIHSIEALARFEKSEFNCNIEKLIETSHRMGNSLEFYNYLLDAGLRAYKNLIQEIDRPVFLNINVSISQITTVSFADNFIDRINELQITSSSIYIELTEQALKSNEDFLLKNIKQLQNIGVKFSIDDFGTGYSSIKRLVDYNFEQIKLDRSFFVGIKQSKKLQEATKIATQLGKNLGMEVLAEGIETKEELSFAQRYDINYIQGYLFCKPINQKETIELLKNQEEE